MVKDTSTSSASPKKQASPLNAIDKLGVDFVGLLERAVADGLCDTDIAFAMKLPVEAIRSCKRAHNIGPKDRLEEVGLTEPVLRKLYCTDGLTMEEIAIKHGCGVATIRRGLLKYKIPIQSSGKRKQLRIEEIRTLSEQGLGCDQIADKLRVSKTSVQRVVRQQFDAFELNHILWLEGASDETIARRLGVPADAVKKFVRTKMAMVPIFWALTPEQRPVYIREMAETTKQGRRYTVEEISRMFGLDADRIKKFLSGGKMS